jgi:hypothetical protein
VWWYLRNIYFPPGFGGNLNLISTLSVVGLVAGIRRRQWTRIYLGALIWVPVAVLSTLFSAHSGRYTFVTLPFLFILGGLGALDVLRFTQRALGALDSRRSRVALTKMAVRTTAILGVLWLVLSVTSGVRAYGLAASRVAGVPYAHVRVNYTALYSYFERHVQPDDELMTLAPSVIFTYYTGREPDFILSRSKAKLLYIIEHDNRAVDTDWGKPLLFTTADLNGALSSHRRIWLFADQSSLNALPSDVRQLVLSTFRPKVQSESGTLYLWQT